MTIEKFQKDVDQWIKTIGVRYFNELTNMAILTEEVGEVSSLMARIYGEQSFKNVTDENELSAKLADELADVIWVVTCIANQTGINLTEAIERNMDKKTKRDRTRHHKNKKLK